MDAFALRKEIIDQYKSYVTSFIYTRDPRIKRELTETLRRELDTQLDKTPGEGES